MPETRSITLTAHIYQPAKWIQRDNKNSLLRQRVKCHLHYWIHFLSHTHTHSFSLSLSVWLRFIFISFHLQHFFDIFLSSSMWQLQLFFHLELLEWKREFYEKEWKFTFNWVMNIKVNVNFILKTWECVFKRVI
jgi:hypothetical protein